MTNMTGMIEMFDDYEDALSWVWHHYEEYMYSTPDQEKKKIEVLVETIGGRHRASVTIKET